MARPKAKVGIRPQESERIENKDWTPYWLRHSFGTYQMETLNQDEIMKLMGHNVAATTRIYDEGKEGA
ncbi:MAG: hypothetical protein LBU17_11765 [Treponema sp.]|jgi:site-specific recombinase XerD|nr:hypothetical protein [Treponema sp.]